MDISEPPFCCRNPKLHEATWAHFAFAKLGSVGGKGVDI